MAAPAHVATGTAGGNGIENFDITVNISGSDRAILATSGVEETTVPTVTYDPGGADEQAGVAVANAANGGANTRMFKIIGPTGSGNKTVRFNFVGGAVGACAASLFSGVDPTTPLGTPATATGESTTPSVDVGSATGETVVDGLCGNVGAGESSTPGTGQTERYDLQGGTDVLAVGSDESGAATVTMSHTFTNSGVWATVGVALKPVSATAQAIAATAVGVAGLSTAATFVKEIAATAVAVATIIKGQFKTLAATAVGVARLSAARLVAQAISAVASGVASLSKVPTFTKALAATAVGTTALSTVFTAAVAAVTKVRRRIGRLLVNPGTLLRR